MKDVGPSTSLVKHTVNFTHPENTWMSLKLQVLGDMSIKNLPLDRIAYYFSNSPQLVGVIFTLYRLKRGWLPSICTATSHTLHANWKQ